jgi:hypothetical protein
MTALSDTAKGQLPEHLESWPDELVETRKQAIQTGSLAVGTGT